MVNSIVLSCNLTSNNSKCPTFKNQKITYCATGYGYDITV